MNEETVTEVPTTKSKTQIARKALIVVSATVGLIIAGGFVLSKKSDDCECEFEVADSDADPIDEINDVTEATL